MTSCRRGWRHALAAMSLAVMLPGCVTGHLLAAGRRREYAREMEAPVEEDGVRVLRYTAEVTDDAGATCGTVTRTVRLAPGEPVPGRRNLTRVRTAPWVYPLMPFSLAVDGVLVPTLVVLAPAMLIVGD